MMSRAEKVAYEVLDEAGAAYDKIWRQPVYRTDLVLPTAGHLDDFDEALENLAEISDVINKEFPRGDNT